VSRGFAVATSGGRDSTALLHATLSPAAAMGLEVHAFHVHHGLHADADGWMEHVQRQCQRWAQAGAPLRFHGQRLTQRPKRGESVEAWARRARYEELGNMAREAGVTLVLLAHHRRDQAETFLLQALRGAGPAGLAAMPRTVERDGIVWARPWLDHPREAIEAYVKRHRLSVVEDPANQDTRFARSRLRQAVWPALARSFPDVDGVLAAAAARLREAAQAVEEWSAVELARVCEHGVLRVDAWETLSPGQRALVLRAWLKDRLGQGAPDALVKRLMKELPGCAPARWPVHPGWELRRFRGRLDFDEVDVAPAPAATTTLQVTREGRYEVPTWKGALQVSPVREGGIALARLQHCELRPRTGAEQFRAAPMRPARSLKKQFQAAAIPPWQRRAPLLYSGDRLVFVPGLGIDADAVAEPGAPRVQLDWLPSSGAFAAPQ